MNVDVRLVTGRDLPAPDPDSVLLAEALRGRGMSVEVSEWRDANVDWSSAAVTVLRSPWDYVDAFESFTQWLHAASAQTRLWNPAPLVEWNLHKSYLLDVAERGAPIVPTVVLLHHTAADLDALADAQGWNTLVVKPAVSIGARGAGRFDVGDPKGQQHLDAMLASGDTLVQPYVPSVATDGECSVVLVDGAVTHAVRKQPATGDYRVHEQWGGRTEPAEVPSAAAELATRVCEVLPHPALYARVDLLRLHEQWHVLEVEVTEPRLWLDLAPSAATEALADAVRARVEGRP